LGTAPVTTTVPAALPGLDDTGTASVNVKVPACVTSQVLTVTGKTTGTKVLVPITVTAPDCIATTVTGTNITIQEGQAGSVPVRVTPGTATGDVILGLGQMTVETTLVNGAGSLPIAAGALPVGVHQLSLDYTGDELHRPSTGTVVVTVTAKPAPGAVSTTVSGTAASFDYGTAGAVAVKVTPASSTGTVTLSKGAQVLGSTTLTSGAGTIALAAKSLPAGTHTLTLTYSGDAKHKASTGSVTVVVAKAESTVTAKLKTDKVVVDKTRAKIKVKVKAQGFTPAGKVKIRVAGKTYRATLEDGRAVLKLKTFDKPGRYKAKVSYLGDANTEGDRTRVIIKVKRR
ncbi:MAG TPA: Ig-like domain-containing protein, partial [Nocardioides sp.]|nr:Ig-like domain-containing protein [Nocardioides sp.]